LDISGLRVNFTEGQGAICKMGGFFMVQIYFSMENRGGLGPPFVDRWRSWSTVDRRHEWSKSSPELGLAAALGNDRSPVMAQWREGCTGSPPQVSPGHGWRCCD
jgi:hypothetical protein